MKIPFSTKLPAAILSCLLLMVVACDKDDDKKQEPTFADPTLTITEPTPATGVEIELGQTLDVKLALGAEAGLKELRANDASVKSYTGTEVTDNVTFQVTPTEVGSFTVTFVVKDSKDKTKSVEFKYDAVEPPVPPFIIASLTGNLLSSEESTIEDWDIRTVYAFSNSSDLSSEEVTVQFVASNGDADAVEDPAAAGSKVLSVVPHASNWGTHYVYAMISLGETIPVAELEALPQLEFGVTEVNGDDQTSVTVTPGYTRVIQVDAYYDGTVTDTVSIAAIKQLEPIFGLDLSKGYQIDLLLAKSDPHVTTGGGEITGMYAGYSAWISEPNKWVTLTFEVGSNGVARWLNDGDGPNEEASTHAAAIDEVDVVTLVPAFAQTIYEYDPDNAIKDAIDGDYNRVLFKNLRIVNVAK